jgi:hypothetical protein
MQGVEIGDAVDAEDYNLAVDDELLDPVLERGFHDPWVSPGPVVPVARDQAHTIAVALHAQPVTVIFNLVEPVRG